MATSETAGRSRDSGVWIGLTVSYLLASIGMVQVRAKVFGGYPSGDWPVDGYTWHFVPVFVLIVAAWWLVSVWVSRRRGLSIGTVFRALGSRASPMLGLVIAWSWYGLTGEQFHASGGCTTYPLCHDSGPFLILMWSAPWLLWGGYRVIQYLVVPPAVEPSASES